MAPPVHTYHPPSHPAPGGPDTDAAAAISQLFHAGGPGTTVFLVPRTLYTFYSSVDMAHPGTTIATLGFPSFDSGDQAVVETRADNESVAVRMINLDRTAVKRIHFRGCRGWGPKAPSDDEKERWKREGRMGWLEGGGPLVVMGGPQAQEQILEGCRLEDPRGWTGVHLVDFAQRCRVVDNIVGPCGQQAPGPWADGLSIAGKDSIVTGNTVVDATDGAIVLFCAPGTICSNNTIIARTRNVLGAINMVDDFPFDRNFEQTRVIGNTMKTEGAFIRVGIACGPTSWSPWGPGHTLVYGGHVLHNYFGPGQFGYGITMSGTKNFTVQGNSVVPGTRFAGSTHRFYPNLITAPPSAFVRQWPDRGRVIDCDVLQPDFVEGDLQWVIGIEPEVGDKLIYEGGQVSLDVRGVSRAGEGGIALKGARWEVARSGALVLRRVEGHTDQFGQGEYGRGKVLWSSGSTSAHGADEPQLDFALDGSLAVRSQGGKGDTLWDPTSYLAPYLAHLPPPPSLPEPTEPTPPEKWLSHPRLILQNKQPYLQLRHRDLGLVYSTSYEWTSQDGWELRAGQWIAVAPHELRGTLEPLDVDDGPAPPPSSAPQRPDAPKQQHSHSFGRFVRDIGQSLQQRGIDVGSSFPNMSRAPGPGPAQGPPPIPPRPDSTSTSSSPSSFKPTWLYLSPETSQLILHSSPHGPTSPSPEHVHWAVPNPPVQPTPKNAWLAFQGDGNFVMYSDGGPCWASGTNGERAAHRFVLRAHGEPGGPAFELLDKDGGLIFSSKQ